MLKNNFFCTWHTLLNNKNKAPKNVTQNQGTKYHRPTNNVYLNENKLVLFCPTRPFYLVNHIFFLSQFSSVLYRNCCGFETVFSLYRYLKKMCLCAIFFPSNYIFFFFFEFFFKYTFLILINNNRPIFIINSKYLLLFTSLLPSKDRTAAAPPCKIKLHVVKIYSIYNYFSKKKNVNVWNGNYAVADDEKIIFFYSLNV